MRYFLLFFFLPIAAHAADMSNASLFFTPDEVQTIETLAAKTPPADTDAGDVHLGAVFYYAPDDWVLWLQGVRVTPTTPIHDLQVMEVKPDTVRLRVTTASAARDVVLKPHQTYQLATGKVVEGSGEAPASVSR